MQICLPQNSFFSKNLMRFEKFGIVVTFLALLFANISTAQTASFTSIPAAVNGVITLLPGSTILFTENTQTNLLSNPTTYNWNFGNGQTSSTVGPHAITYSTAGQYTVSLTVSTGGSTLTVAQVTINISNTPSPSSVVPALISGTSITGNGCTQTYAFNGFPVFQTVGANGCTCSAGPLLAISNANQYPTGTTATIYWGGQGTVQNSSSFVSNLSPDYFGSGSLSSSNLTAFPGQVAATSSHYASQGNYHLVYVVTFPNGSIYSSYYIVNFGAGVVDFCGNSAQTACHPEGFELCFDNQFPGNIYSINWGDGSPSEQYVYPNLPVSPNTLNHVYPSSCSQAGVATPYTITVTAANQCPTAAPTQNTQGPFFISTKPEASFTASQLGVCQNQSVNFTNTSSCGFSVITSGQTGTCDNTCDFGWTINGSNAISGAGYTVTGTMGNPYAGTPVSGSNSISVNFTQPGTYTVSLAVLNPACGDDVETKTITVNPIAFIPDQTRTICSGQAFTVSPVNNPPTTIVPPGTTYSWTVVNNPSVNGDVSGSGTSISGTLSNLTNTTQTVVYTVTPTTNGCVGPTFTVTVTVVPRVKIPDYAPTICNGTAFTVSPSNSPPTTIVPSGTSYTWTITNNVNVTGEAAGNGSTISQTLTSSVINPFETVNYSVIASAGGSCPPDTFSIAVAINDIDPGIISGNQTICSGGNPSLLSFSTNPIAGGTVSYQWQSSTNGTTWLPISSGGTSATYDPPNGLTVTTYYRVQVSSTLNSVVCVKTTNELVVTINSLSSGALVNNQTICNPGNPTALTFSTNPTGSGSLSYQWYISTDNSSWTDISGETTLSYDPPTLTNTTYYRVTVESLLNNVSCSSNTNTVVITTNNVTSGVIGADQTICSGGDPANMSFTTAATGTALSYQWQQSTNGSSWTAISGITTPSYNPPAGLTVTTYYRVIVTSNLNNVPCSAITNTVTVFVNTLSGGVLSANQTICSGGDPAMISFATNSSGTGTVSYQWQKSTDNLVWNDVSGANLSSYDPPSGLTATNYYRVLITYTSNGVSCTTFSSVHTIFVNSLTPGAILNNQTVCTGGDPVSMTFSTAATATGFVSFQWQSSPDNSVWSGIASATNASYDPPANATVSEYYRLQFISTLNGVTCTALSNSVLAAVIPDPVISAQPLASQSLCIGGTLGTPLSVSFSGGTGAALYQWSSSMDGATWTNVSGATNSTFSPSLYTVSGIYNYQVTISFSGSGCNTITSTSAVVFVNEDPIVSSQPTSASYCQNSSSITPLSVTVTGGAGTEIYQWYVHTTNSNTGGTLIQGATSQTYTPPVTNLGIRYYYCIVSQTGANCSVVSETATIQVTQGPSFTTQPLASQTICEGGSLTDLQVAYTNGTGVASYQWYSNTTNNIAGGTAISGATSATYSPSSTTVDTSFYYCIISFSSGGCSSISSAIARVVVHPDPTITTQPLATQTICQGGGIPAPFTVAFTGGLGTPSYQWQTYQSGSGTWLTIPSATNVSYNPPSFGVAGTFLYRVTISFPNGNGCGTTTSTDAQVISIPDPTVTSQPQSASYCVNATTVTPLTVIASGGTGTFSYQWYSNTSSASAGGTPIQGATTDTYSPSVSTTGTFYYYCVVSQTGANCQVVSTSAAIVVTALPTFNTQPLSAQTICLGGTPTNLTVSYTNGTGTPSYQWYSNSTNALAGAASISGAMSATYTPPSSTAGTTYYYCVISFNPGGCNPITSTIAAVTILPDPIIATQPLSAQSICVGGTIATPLSVSYSGGIGSATYQWQSSTDGNTWSTIAGATAATYLPAAFTSTGIAYYNAIVSLSGSGCDVITSQPASISVLNDPTVSTQPINATYCQYATPVPSLSVTIANGIGTPSYQWYSNSTGSNSIGTAIVNATNQTYSPPTATIGTVYYYCIVSQSGANCAVNSTAASIQISTQPSVTTQPQGTQTVCVGGTINPLTVAYSNGTGAASYQWYSNVSNASSGGNIINGATTASYTPPTNTAGITYYYCEISFDSNTGCSTIASNTGKITVNADPTITTQPLATQTICEGGTIASPLNVLFTGGTGTTTYVWSSSTDAINYTPIANSNSQNFTPTSFPNDGSYYYQVTISSNSSLGCDPTLSAAAQIIVVDDPIVVQQPTSAVYCQNSPSVSALSVAASGGLGNFSYQWYSNSLNNTTTGQLIPTANAATYTPPVSNIGTIFYYCLITQSGLNCSVTSATAAVQVNQGPTYNQQPTTSQQICLGGTLNTLTVGFINGTGTPSYQWYENTSASTSGGTLIQGATGTSYLPTPNSSGTYYYYNTISFSSGGCGLITSALATVVVHPDPIISAHPLATQSICSGGSVQNPLTVVYANGLGTASYQWQSSIDGQAWSTIANETNASYQPPLLTTTGNYYYNVIVNLNGNGCTSVTSNPAQVTVVADPTVTLQPVDATYCLGATTVSPLVVSANGGIGNFSYQWFVNTSASYVGSTIIIGATSASFVPPVTSVGTRFYYCAITQTGQNCAVNSSPALITTTSLPTFTTQPTTSQTVCLGGTPTSLSVTYANGTGTASYQWYSNTSNSYTNGTLIANATNAIFNPTATQTGTSYYYCKLSLAGGGCPDTYSTISEVIVLPDPSITIQPLTAQELCVGGTIFQPLTISYMNGFGTPSYQWQDSTTGSSWSSIGSASVTPGFSPSVFTQTGSYYFRVLVTLSGSGCNVLTSQNALVTVVADPTIDNQPVAATYCINATTVSPLTVTPTGGSGNFTYQWYSNTGNSTVGGTAISGATSATYTPSVAITGTIYYYCIVGQSSANCSVTSTIAAITVTPAPTITANPPASQSVCVGGTLTAFAISYTNGTGTPSYQWYSNAINSYASPTLIPNATAATYTAPTSVSGTTYYFCTISFSSGDCAAITSTIAEVVVHPDPIITAQPTALQSLCVGGTLASPLSVQFTGGTGTVSYQWSSATNNSAFSPIPNQTAASFLPPVFDNPITIDYQVTISLNGNGCNAVTSAVAAVIVVLDPTITTQPVSAVYCQGASSVTPLFVQADQGTGTFNYQWYSNVINSTTNAQLISGATAATYTPSVANTGTVYYYCLVTQTGNNCSVTSNIVAIQVAQGANFTSQPILAQTACVGGSVANLTVNYSNGSGTPTYQWYQNTNNSSVGGTALVGANSATYSPATATAGILYYYCQISFPIQGCSLITSSVAAVTILSDPSISQEPLSNQTICQGSTIAQPLTINYSGGSGTPSYLWQSSTNGSTWSDINTATNSAFSPLSFASAGTYYYRVQLSLSGSGCNTVFSQPAQITVNPIPTVNPVTDQVFCNAVSSAVIPLTGPISGATYQWTNATTAIGLGATGVGNIPIFTTTNTTNNPLNAAIGITPTYVFGGVTCTGPAQTFTITVNPSPVVTDPQDVVVCANAATPTVVFTGTGTSYTWINNTPSIGLAASGTGNINAFTAQNTTDFPVTATITVTPVYTTGNLSCTSAGQTFTITVNPTPRVDSLANQVVCNGSSILAVNFTGTGTGYNWTNNLTTIGLNASGTGSIPSFTAINSGTTAQVATVTITPIYTNLAQTCNGPQRTVLLTILPTPIVNNPTDLVVCNGGATTLVNFTGTANTYTWTNDQTSIGLLASGTGNIPSFTTTNSSNVPVVATIVVTPTYTTNGLTCSGTNQSMTITVNPTATLADPTDQTVCNGSSVAAVTFNGTGTSYSWTNTQTTIGLSANGTGNITSFTATNSGVNPLTGTITVTPNYLNAGLSCPGVQQSFAITVNPTPTVQFNLGNQTICSQLTTNLVNLTSTTPNVDIVWQATTIPPAITGLTVTNGTISIPAFTLINTAATPQTIVFTATATTTGNAGCGGTVSTYTITVNPTPSVVAPSNQVVCNGTTVASSAFTGTGTTYAWSNNQSAVGLAPSGIGTVPAFTAINTGTAPLIATITVVPQFTNNALTCNGPQQNFTITINPTPVIAAIPDVSLCNGQTSSAIAPIGNATSYAWVNGNNAIGLTANGTGNIPSFPATNAGTVPINSVVTVTPFYTNAGATCQGNDDQFIIYVNPTPTVANPADIVVCNGAPTPSVTFTGTGTSYSWQNATTSIGLGATGSGVISSFTATNSGNSPVSSTVVVTPIYAQNGISCPGNTQDLTITVNPSPTVIDPSDQTLCNGSSTTAITINGTGTSYAWTNNNTAIGLIGSGNTAIPVFTAQNTSALPIASTVTITPTFTGSGVTCSGPTQSVSFTVNPTPVVNQPLNITVCNGSAVSSINFSGTANGYTWTNSISAIGLAATGSGNIPSFTALNNTAVPITATITVTPTFTNLGVTCTGLTKTFTIIINPSPTVNDLPNQVVCNASPVGQLLFTGTGTSYSWTNTTPSIGLAGTGTGNIPTFSAINATAIPKVANITVTPIYFNNGLSCSGTPEAISITVNPTPTVAAPQNRVVCSGLQTTQINFVGTGTSYSWTNNNPSIGLAAAGTGLISPFTAVNNTNAPLVATITVTPIYSNQLVDCQGTPVSFTITVNPTPAVNDPIDQVVCNNTSTTAISFTGTGTSYSWTNSTPSIGLPINGIGNISSFTATNGTAGQLNGVITVTPLYTNAGLTCSGLTQTASIFVNPNPFVQDPVDVVFCNGELTTPITFTGNGTYYTWVNNSTTIGLPATGSGAIPSFLATNGSDTVQNSALITVTAFYDQSGVVCQGNSQVFKITVNPTPSIQPIPSQVFCNGTATAAVNFVGTGTSYSWTNNNTFIGIAASGIGNIPSFAAQNSGGVAITGNIAVTPIYTSIDGTSCAGIPQSFGISVNPSPIINPISNFSSCNNATLNVPISANVMANFTWFADPNPNVSGDVNFPQPSSLINNTLTNNTMVMQYVTYHIEPTSSPEGCAGPPISFVVEVVPDVTLTSLPSTEICSGAFVNTQLQANVPASFSWIAANNFDVVGETTSLQTGPIISDFLTNNSTQNQLVVYSVFPTSINGGCLGAAQTFGVIVRPPLAMLNEDTIAICSAGSPLLNLQTNVAAGFNWFADNNPSVLGESTTIQTSSFIGDVLVNTSTVTQEVHYTVVASSTINGCSSPIFDVIVYVNPEPVITNTDITLCSGDTANIQLTSTVASQFEWSAAGNAFVTGESTQSQFSSSITDVLTNTTALPQQVVYSLTPISVMGACPGVSDIITVTVTPMIQVSFTAVGNLCTETPISFNNTSQLPLDFAWDFGDGNSATTLNASTSYTSSGNYMVTLTGTDIITGCSNEFSSQLVLLTSPQVGFTASDTIGCVVMNTLFTDTINQANTTLFWDFGDGQTSNQSGSIDHQYTTAGCYDVTLTVSNAAGCTISQTQPNIVCVYDVPIASFTVDNDSMYTENTLVNFNNNTVHAVTYNWEFGDNTTSSATNPSHYFPELAGNYPVILYAYNEAGCYDSTMLIITVEEELLYYVPNTITVNQDGVNDVFLPIFTSGYEEETYELTIYNRWGELIFVSTDVNEGWDGSYLNAIVQQGVYTWKITFVESSNQKKHLDLGHVTVLR
jgi:gliding motility-associated-like protein